MTTAPDNLTRDRFLGGQLSVLQPKQGYRAGIDPVMLAAATPARPGESVLELGCGVGVALLCLGARVQGLSLTGIDVQPEYADLARRNAELNGQALEIHCADLRELPDSVRSRTFDHVIANPPYFEREHGSIALDPGRDLARAGATSIDEWIRVAAKRLAPKGYLTLIQDVRRLPEVLAVSKTCLGSIEVLPIAAREARAPHTVLIRARKGGRAAFCLHAPLIMHEGQRHIADGDSYTPEITAILREGAALPFPGDRERV